LKYFFGEQQSWGRNYLPARVFRQLWFIAAREELTLQICSALYYQLSKVRKRRIKRVFCRGECNIW